MKVLEFIQDHPQYNVRKGDAKWEILGIPTPLKELELWGVFPSNPLRGSLSATIQGI